jgi:hypothetical protein
VDTAHYGGQTMRKTATVVTNDPHRPSLPLSIGGTVKPVAQVEPARLVFQALVGQRLRQSVSVTPNPEKPFTVQGMRLKEGRDVRGTLRPPGAPGEPWVVIVELTRETPGRIYDILFLDTDSPTRPVLSVPIFGTVAEAPKPQS